jgi:hypothetical protein
VNSNRLINLQQSVLAQIAPQALSQVLADLRLLLVSRRPSGGNDKTFKLGHIRGIRHQK